MKTFVGIDWSRDQHQVNLYNAHGACLKKLTIQHSQTGFAKLAQQLKASNPEATNCVVGIETQHNQLVDFLLAGGYKLYIIAPSIVQGSRSRQSNAGAKNDDKDAALLADILRTDQKRLLPWQPNGVIIRQLVAQLSHIDDLTAATVRGHNRLEAHLLRYFPQSTTVFSSLTTQIALQLLIAYPSPSAVADLTYEQFTAFCQSHGYKRPKHLPRCFARLQRPIPFPDLVTEAVFAPLTPQLARRLLADVQLKAAAIKRVQKLFATHPDQAIFHSLPGAGALLAPKLLTIFGDHRTRFPTPDLVRALAGTAPVTRQSGRKRAVLFRRACNHAWRNTCQQFALASLSESPWAASYFDNARQRGLSDSHALRCLANRWLGIIWTLWQRRLLYDESVHWRNVRRHKQPFAP